MKILVSTKKMPREEWLVHRTLGLGGSDAPAVAGVSRWKTPLQVWLEKTGVVPPASAQSEAAYWGTRLEDIIAEEFARRTGMRVERLEEMLQHPEYPFMIANIDRIILDENGRATAILECKTAGEFRRHEWDDGKIPDEYIVQVQHYLAVTGLQTAYIAALIGGQTFLIREIERDDELIDYLIRIEADFWRLVESRTPPPIDGSDAAAELLKKLYPEAKAGSAIDLPTEAEALIRQWREAKAEEEAAAARRQEAENKLKALLEDKEVGLLGGKPVVTWKNFTRKTIDSKRLKKDYPDIYDQYAKESTYRKFKILIDEEE